MYMSVTVCTSLPQSNEQVTFINIHHVSLVRSVYTIFCIWRTFLKLSAISLSANIQGYIIINNYFVYYANMCSLTFSDAHRVILQVICIYVQSTITFYSNVKFRYLFNSSWPYIIYVDTIDKNVLFVQVHHVQMSLVCLFLFHVYYRLVCYILIVFVLFTCIFLDLFN